MGHKIVCIGEILWDSIPEGLFLGGAPFNVAYHLTRLGNEVSFVSKTGTDQLGGEALKRVKKAGLSTDYLQVDPELMTGFVEVELGEEGIPEYEIIKPVAWDEIELTGDVKKVMKSAEALVFGTLAQRSETSRMTIQWMENCDGVKFLDLNFRSPYVDKEIVEHSMRIADVVKLNTDELEELQSWYDLSAGAGKSMGWLAEKHDLQAVCLTRGSEGALLWKQGAFYEAGGFDINVTDTVGSGDAFLAAFVSGYLAKMPFDKLLEYSNRLGAYVATRSGGTPGYSLESYSDIPLLPMTSA